MPDTPSLLLVEDDETFATLLATIADGAGFRVDLAGSVQAAREKIRGANFDVFLLDFNLPDGDARDVLAFLDESPQAGAPVLVVSAQPGVSELLPEDTQFMPKPVQARSLRAELVALVVAGGPSLHADRLPPRAPRDSSSV